jgi:hypothetical protein
MVPGPRGGRVLPVGRKGGKISENNVGMSVSVAATLDETAGRTHRRGGLHFKSRPSDARLQEMTSMILLER